MQKTLLSLIQQAKPRRALFTTYTFSIFWFETFVLPTLRNCGCEQIDVLVDAREACKSTGEATSLHAGNAYRVIPVYMDGTGVFHPKLAYLQGAEHDQLVVSSANLTLAGHGKNLEVIDAVGSHKEPAVFGEFAGFLDALVRQHEFAPENEAVLRSYQRRAQSLLDTAGNIDEAGRTAWLVHFLEQPAADQFAVLANRIRRPEKLSVLSPYHSPSGEPVQNLAAAVRAASIRVGISAVTCHAPFDESMTCFTEPVEFVVADTEDAHRFPHAKCFELEGENGVLVMTGSVNATSQSLESTTNVETSLVRLLKESPFSWTMVEPKAYRPCDFASIALTARNPALQATWTTAHRIVGQVRPAPGEMPVTLSIWEGATCLAQMSGVTLKENGSFSVRMKDYFECNRALRLELAGEDLLASGWLNIEFELSADERERNLIRAANRMRAGDFHLSDIASIFAWFQGLQSKQPAGEGGSPTGGAGPKRESVSVGQLKLTYEEWRDDVEQFQAFGCSADVARISLEAAFKWLNRDLDVKPPVEGENKPEATGDSGSKDAALRRPKMQLLTTERAEFEDDWDDADETDEDRLEDEGNTLFQKLMESLPRALELDAQSAIVPMMVELSGCAVLKRALSHLEQASERAALGTPEPLVIDVWLTRFSAFDYSVANRERLLPFFCALACCAAHYHRNASLQGIKEALQRLAGRAVPADEIEELARMALNSTRFVRVDPTDRDAIATSGQVVEMCETLSQQLAALIADTVIRPELKPIIPSEYSAVFGALRQHRKSKDKAFGLVRAKGSYCPCCTMTLQAGQLMELRAKRAIVCNNITCQRPVFYGLDKTELAEKGLAGRYKG